jgi:hypothetical protein
MSHVQETAETAKHPRLSAISKTMVVKVLDKAEVKPFRIKYYCEKHDPEFETKMLNVLVVYKQISMRFEKMESHRI